jgi:clan AA aspartic protease (TIGR02281 family)
MKKVLYTLSVLFAAQLSFGQQSVMDLANDANCTAQENILKPIIKSSEHDKRGQKASTWVRLSEAYANYTTACGRDSTSATKAWEALKKAKELDTDGSAAEDIEKLLHAKPTSLMYSAVMNQGVAYYNVGNLDKAVELFMIGMEVDPKDTLSTFYSGIVSNQLENYDDAVKAFTQYIDVAGGKDVSAFYTLSVIATNKGDVNESIKWLKKGVEVTGDKDLQGELINTYIRNDMLKDAVADMEKLVELDPSNSNNLLNLGILYDNEGRNAEALDIYQKVLSLDPNNYDCNFNLAVFYFNDAVKIKGKVDAMDIKTYQKEGAAIEKEVCSRFLKSKPYFLECNRIKPNTDEIVQNLETLDKVLSQCRPDPTSTSSKITSNNSPKEKAITSNTNSKGTIIPLRSEGGVYFVKGKVNGLELDFIVDTGASKVLISLTEALFMLKNGQLNKEDLKGTTYSQIANGDLVEGTSIILKEIIVGGYAIHNVEATFSHEMQAPLLLGNTALKKIRGSSRYC